MTGSLFSGLLLTLSFPNLLHPEPYAAGATLAWCALVPLLRSLQGEAPGSAFRKGYACGALFFILSLIWINNVRPMGAGAPPAWLALSAYCAFYPALFAAVYALGRRQGWPAEGVWVPALWTLLECAREKLLTGFPWVSLGSSQAQVPWLLPLAAATGVWGLHFSVTLGNLLIHWALQGELRKHWKPSAVVVALLAALRFWPQPDGSAAASVKVAVLQGNIDQDQAWTESYRHRILSVYGRLMQEAVQAGAQVVLWPESAYPGFFNQDGLEARTLKSFARRHRIQLLIGSSLIDPSGPFYENAVVHIDADGNTASYSKRHLVPFGEFIPLRRRIPLLDRVLSRLGITDFREGHAAKIFAGAHARIQPLLCYESIYGEWVERKQDFDILAVSTVDTWFGNSAAPRYHLLHAALRAAESGRCVARVAATGISGFALPPGRLQGLVALNQEGWSLAELPLQGDRRTLHQRYFAWFPWLCLVLLSALALMGKGKNQAR